MGNPAIDVNYPVMVKFNQKLTSEDREIDALSRLSEGLIMIKETKFGDGKSELQTKHWLEDNKVFVPHQTWKFIAKRFAEMRVEGCYGK